MTNTNTVGVALIDLLEGWGIDTVFGIPGVHTVELYRGLENSNIRHITPRHELGAGFMADGYARATGKPGVCFVITGPGLTNILTAMAQARADSIPMLVISGVNNAHSLGHEDGYLHELPDQTGTVRTIAKYSHTLLCAGDLKSVLDRAFIIMMSGRPGPVHIEIPVSVMSEIIVTPNKTPANLAKPYPDPVVIKSAAEKLRQARRPVILAGGGCLEAKDELSDLAHALDAPVVTTTNARGIMAGDPLCIPASPSLPAIRDLLASADVILAAGTQFGPTDYDMYGDGEVPELKLLIRIDIDALQLTRGISSDIAILADANNALSQIYAQISDPENDREGHGRARRTRERAYSEIGPEYRASSELIANLSKAVPDAIIVGDSTQAVYAGNMYCDLSPSARWFNSATGFGTLGFGLPAAIGANIGRSDCPVICIIGDGGIQFCLSELGTVVDENTPVVILVWNNFGYGEIENYMLENSIAPIGVRPSPPEFQQIAAAYKIPYEKTCELEQLPSLIAQAISQNQPVLIEYCSRTS